MEKLILIGPECRTQIDMFRPIRMDHTNCLQVAIKSIQSIILLALVYTQVHGFFSQPNLSPDGRTLRDLLTIVYLTTE